MPYCTKCGARLADDALFCPNCGTPVSARTPQGSGGSPMGGALPESGLKALIENPQAQSYWVRRVAALVIDYIVLAIAVGIIAVLLFLPTIATGVFAPGLMNAGVFPLIVGLFSILYFPAFEVYRGATIGKSFVGLRVIASDGSRLSWWQAFVRNISKIYWVLLLLDAVVGLAVQADYRQKFSDRYAGTLVTLT